MDPIEKLADVLFQQEWPRAFNKVEQACELLGDAADTVGSPKLAADIQRVYKQTEELIATWPR